MFCAVCTAALLAATSETASAGITTLSTLRITNNGNTNVASQIKIVVASDAVDLNTLFPTVYANVAANEIAATAANQVNFIFVNLGATAASITDVYFDDGSLLGIADIFSSLGVDYDTPASPGNLPGGQAINFNTTAGFSADSNPPVQPNGVNPGEWLTVQFNLIGGQDYDDVMAAIALGQGQAVDIAGALRIGLHIQAIAPQGGSDSYVNGPPGAGPNEDVPEPASLTLAALGALGAVVVGRRRRSQAH